MMTANIPSRYVMRTFILNNLQLELTHKHWTTFFFTRTVLDVLLTKLFLLQDDSSIKPPMKQI